MLKIISNERSVTSALIQNKLKNVTEFPKKILKCFSLESSELLNGGQIDGHGFLHAPKELKKRFALGVNLVDVLLLKIR